MKKNKLSDQQISFITNNINSMSRTELAKLVGISTSTLLRIAKCNNIFIPLRRRPANSTQHKLVIALYPNNSTREIARMVNLDTRTVLRIAHKNNLKHTLQTVERLRQKQCISAKNLLNKETRLKACNSRKRTYRMEAFRVMSGMPQKTKIRIAILPTCVRKTIYRLKTQFNYFADRNCGDAYTLFFDSATRRSPREDMYALKYGIKFRDADYCTLETRKGAQQ